MTIAQKSPVQARIRMMCQKCQQTRIKLKLRWHRVPQFVDAVQKLDENRTLLITCGLVDPVSFCEHMPESQEVFVDQRLEPVNSSVVRIQHKLGKSAHLRSAVPPVRAVDDHIRIARIKRIEDLVHRIKYGEDNLVIFGFVDLISKNLLGVVAVRKF